MTALLLFLVGLGVMWQRHGARGEERRRLERQVEDARREGLRAAGLASGLAEDLARAHISRARAVLMERRPDLARIYAAAALVALARVFNAPGRQTPDRVSGLREEAIRCYADAAGLQRQEPPPRRLPGRLPGRLPEHGHSMKGLADHDQPLKRLADDGQSLRRLQDVGQSPLRGHAITEAAIRKADPWLLLREAEAAAGVTLEGGHSEGGRPKGGHPHTEALPPRSP